ASLYRCVAMLSPRSNDTADIVSLHHTGSSLDHTSSSLHHTSSVPLSRRELQIAHLIDRGLTNKEIAPELGIEAATVKNHVHNICRKLNVHRRGEAVARLRAMLRTHAPLSAEGRQIPAP